jgi:putative ABC transport system ATP-binding protein
MLSTPVIETKKLSKAYGIGTIEVYALREVSIKVERGEFVAIMGSSGSGKSTLLNLLGCLDRPTSGSYILEGQDVASLGDKELARTRNCKIGFVFQTFNLLPRLSAQRNVELPLSYSRDEKGVHSLRTRELLEMVGLGKRLRHRPTEMSGGEQQRVAIARALVNDPPIILADEPTGNLDSATGKEVMALLRKVVEEGRTLVMVTHDKAIGEQADRIVWLRDGALSTGES